uniref:Uncharacterized protein n=1 Tax=Solanum tuberosum TaxID=4113 RepID=M1DZZ5_SOLTU
MDSPNSVNGQGNVAIGVVVRQCADRTRRPRLGLTESCSKWAANSMSNLPKGRGTEWYLKFEGKYGHHFAKRNEKAEKNKENDCLGIAKSTWRVAEGSHSAFCSSVMSLEGKDQVDGKREQSAHHREVLRGSTMSPNDPEHDDAEEWCKTTKKYITGRIAELIGD